MNRYAPAVPGLRPARPRPTAAGPFAAGVLAALAGASLVVSCGPRVPNLPDLNEASGTPGSVSTRWADRVLDDRDRERVRAAMRASAGDRTSAEVGPGPRPRPDGRWRDVPDAVASAGADLGVAVVSTRFEPGDATDPEAADAIEFVLLTLANEPGRLRVERRDPPAILEATAEIGLFRQRRDLARRLEAGVLEQLRRWGLKPELEPLAPDPAP